MKRVKNRVVWTIVAVLVVALLWFQRGLRNDGTRSSERAAGSGDAVEVRAEQPTHRGHRSSRQQPGPEAPPSGATVERAESIPFDVSAIRDRVRLAYRPGARDGELEGGHSTYVSRVDEHGVTLRAFHYRRSTPSTIEAHGAAEAESDSLGGDLLESGPIRLRTAAVVRGVNASSVSGGVSPEVGREGHAEIDYGGVIEILRNEVNGIEQSWRFDGAPTGRGDLTVTVEVGGQEFAGENESGLHFVDRETGIGFRYGHATWIDASGTRTDVPARRVGKTIELIVAHAVVEASAFPAVLDPIISPEFGMDAPVAMGQKQNQVRPAAAPLGDNYLVVWSDVRVGTVKADIYGARVSPLGEVLDPVGFLICGAAEVQDWPDLASHATGALVVWHDYRNGPGPSWDIYGSRISLDGEVLDPDGIVISGAAYIQQYPSVTTNGSGYFVAWEDARPAVTRPDIYGTRVTLQGDVLDPDGIPISLAPATQQRPSVTSNGTHHFVVWHDRRNAAVASWDVYGARVTFDGQVLDPDGIVIAGAGGGQGPGSVASDGTDFFVVYPNFAADTDMYGARVTSAGVVLDPDGLVLGSAVGQQLFQKVVWDGTGYFAAWRDDRDVATTGRNIYGTRITPAGGVVHPGGLAIATAVGDQEAPAVTSNGNGILAVWSDGRSGPTTGFDIYGARVTSAGVLEDPDGFIVSTAANIQESPSVASNGDEYLVVWHDYRNHESSGLDVHGTRVSSTGEILDPSGLILSAATRDQDSPSVASNGDGYLVSWHDRRVQNQVYVYGTRVGAGGVVEDPDGLPIAVTGREAYFPAIASNGSDYLVVFSDRRNAATTGVDIFGARVTSLGVVEDPDGIEISTAPGTQHQQKVASDGNGYFVVWRDQNNGDIQGAGVSAAGAVLHPAGVVISSHAQVKQNPAIASTGDGYLVVWEDRRDTVSSFDIYGARVTSGGVTEDPGGLPIGVAPNFQQRPAVAANGAGYLVVWQDLRNGGIDIYGTNVLGGEVRPSEGIPFAAAPDSDEQAPSLVGSGTELLLVYQRHVAEESLHAERVRGRIIRYGGELGAACAFALECASGYCVDGVCCDSPCGESALDCQACSIGAGATTDGACEPIDAVPCSDGDGCTRGDFCVAGLCQPGSFPCLSGTDCTALGGEAFACGACPEGTYSLDGTGSSECIAYYDCAPGTYVELAGSATSDRVCAPCGIGTYSSSANAPLCAPFAVCPSGEYILENGTSSSDRVCETCPDGTFNTTANATSCFSWRTCVGGEYEIVTPSSTSDRVCSPITDCMPGEYEVVQATTTSDRICAGCESGTYSAQSNATACLAFTDCVTGTYVVDAGTASADRVCAPCPTGTYSADANVTACTPFTDCPIGSYVLAAGTASADRVCAPCEPGTFSAQTNTETCLEWMLCDVGAFETVPPAEENDRVCTPLTVCAEDEFEATAPTPTSDRVCTGRTVCTEGEFEATAPTPTSDRVCAALTDCIDGEFEETAPTPMSDRICAECTACPADTAMLEPCTEFEDTVCVASEPDAGVVDEGPRDSGCGCSASGRTMTHLPLPLLVLFAWILRRRLRAPKRSTPMSS